MTEAIDDVAALEARIGKTPAPVRLKVIDHLDEGARRWIAASRLAFVTFGDAAGGAALTLAGGPQGFARALGPTRLSLAPDLIDDPSLARPGCGAGALFLVPGIGETLRINGQVAAAGAAGIEIEVAECYVHCAKAFIRSGFWQAQPSEAPDEASAFLAASRFLALGTVDGEGQADASPKGDPQGTLIRLQDGNAWYADRPGNRRADSFRNILTQPRVAVAALVLGSTKVALLTGAARITAAEGMRAAFAVEEKVPLLVTCIERPRLTLADSPALARAALWPAPPRPEAIDPAATIAAHVRLNRAGGLQARLVRAAASVPGLVAQGLRQDYKKNLY